MIPGGYILKARKALESDLMDKPPLWSKLWDWMLLRAEWRSDGKLPRGSFLTTIDEMREAMSWLVGYRRVTPTKDEIRSAYEGFAKATMATTTKTTRGMIVSIVNYDTYQRPENYEAHSEAHNEKDTKPTVTPHDSKEVKEQEEQEEKGTPPTPRKRGMSGYSESFEQFWAVYPMQKGKAAAFRSWQAIPKKHQGVKPPQIIAAVKAQVEADAFRSTIDGNLYIPHPATWLNQGRWDDVFQKVETGPPKIIGSPRPTTVHQRKQVEGEQKALMLQELRKAREENGQGGDPRSIGQGGLGFPVKAIGG